MSKPKEIRDIEGFAVLARRLPHKNDKAKHQSKPAVQFSDKDDKMTRLRKERDAYREMCFRQSEAITVLSDRLEEMQDMHTELLNQGEMLDEFRDHIEHRDSVALRPRRHDRPSAKNKGYRKPVDDDDQPWDHEVGFRISGSRGPEFYSGPDKTTTSLGDIFKIPRFDGIEIGFDPEHGFRFGIKGK